MNKEKKIDVVFSIDAGYIQHFCVALTSLLENNLQSVGRIFLITNIVDKALLQDTLSFILSKYKKEVTLLAIDDIITKKFKVDSYVSQAAYYRLFLSEILPDGIDKILYLDSDIVVTKNLDSLFELEFESGKYDNGKDQKDYYLYAVSELSWQEVDRLQGIGLSGTKYFNSGVLLVNLKKWRAENISKALISIALSYKDKLTFWDQDVLNIAFENDWGELENKYNSVNVERLDKKIYERDYSIIHYTGGSKPWRFNNRHPLKWLYWYYLWKTPYKYYIPKEFTFKNILKKLLKGSSTSKTELI